MAFSYLEGGKTLKGVTPLDILHDDSSWFYVSESSPSSSSSMHHTDNNQQELILRRLGLSSTEFERHLLKARNNDADDNPQARLITTLDASRNQIKGAPSEIRYFSNLTLLNLACNNIAAIPEAILGLSKLQQLYLSENQISSIPESMPTCLTELTVLNLDSNQIKVLPQKVGEWKKLREFRLGSEYGGNMIAHLPESICDMQALVELDLSFNELETVGPLHDLQRLKYLNLSHNHLRQLPSFANCPQLATLDLSDNLLQTILHAAASSIMRLMLHCRLQLLNLSNNGLEIIPTELLDQTQTQVIIQGNPLVFYHEQQGQDSIDDGITALSQDNNTQSINDAIQITVPMMDYNYRHMEDVSLAQEENPATNDTHTTTERQEQPMYLLHSLREITLRTIAASTDNRSLLSEVPEHLADDIQENLQTCHHCQLPFLHEWVSAAHLCTYQAHRSVPRQIRFCGTACLLSYKEKLQQEALAAQSEVYLRQQQQDALAYIVQHRNVLDPDSFEWVMAASVAATAQEEQADLLANAVFMATTR